MRYIFTIRDHHVANPHLSNSQIASEAIGALQPCDVGKRVYLHLGVICVENDAQRDARVTA